MGRNAIADRETIRASLAAIEAAYDRLEDCSFDAFSAEELVAVLASREALAWRAPVVDHRILARLVTDGDPGALGACSLVKALAGQLRISTAVARRRLGEAAELGPRTAISGEPLDPVLPELAAAQAAGRIGPEQVVIARKAWAKIPAGVSAADRERAERDLAVLASEFAPETFARLADHLVAVLNPDGDFTDAERQARRGLRLGRQGLDGMSTLSGKITPELRATLEPILAKLGAPGMCNAADGHPCVSGTPTQEQISDDYRRPDQRHHDALLAASRAVLACGDLGQLNGLPVTVIVTTTLAELQAAAEHAPGAEQSPAAVPPLPAERQVTGKALTAGGTPLPMTDLLRMAGHAYHYLALFDGAGRALWLGRSKRIATGDQRIVLHGRDHGCTRPGCSVSGYLTQVHHLERDWANGGRTDIDALALACAPDNRMATEQGWLTRLGETGRVEWIPPPKLDRGQPRINPFHFIEAIIDNHRRRKSPDTEQPPPVEDWPEPWPDDGPWLDDPLQGDFDHDPAFEDLRRRYEAMDLDEFAKQPVVADDDWAEAQ